MNQTTSICTTAHFKIKCIECLVAVINLFCFAFQSKPAFNYEAQEKYQHELKNMCSPTLNGKSLNQPTSTVPQDIFSFLKLTKETSCLMPMTLTTVLVNQEEKRRSINNFLEHLRGILSKMTEFARMDLQEQIIVTAYQRNRELWLTRQTFPSVSPRFPFQQPYHQPLYQQPWPHQQQQPFAYNNFPNKRENVQEPARIRNQVDDCKFEAPNQQLNIHKDY